jgi:hypothetical protein
MAADVPRMQVRRLPQRAGIVPPLGRQAVQESLAVGANVPRRVLLKEQSGEQGQKPGLGA